MLPTCGAIPQDTATGALPIVAVIFLIVTPGRVRTTLTLLLVLGGVGITIPAALDVFDKSGRALAGAMGTDGQHLVVLRQLAHRAPVPGAFERGIAP